VSALPLFDAQASACVRVVGWSSTSIGDGINAEPGCRRAMSRGQEGGGRNARTFAAVPGATLSLSAARDMVPTTEKIDVGFRRPLRVDDDERDGKHFVI